MKAWLLVGLAACGSAAPIAEPSSPPPPPTSVARAVAPDVPIAAPIAAPIDPSSYAPQMGSEWPGMDHETIGGLALGAPAIAAIALAGKPTARTQPQLMGATGDYVAEWTFARGVEMQVSADQPKGPFSVRVITVGAPCTWKTVEGIGIGSTLAQVKAAFGAYLSPPTKDSPSTSWLVGSVYGGLQLTIEHDLVAGMYLGAMAF